MPDDVRLDEVTLFGPEIIENVELVLRADDGDPVVLRGQNAAADSPAVIKGLIERSMKLEHIELLLTATTYGQGPGFANSNYVRFTASALQQFAKSAPGTPYSRNHSLATEDRGGRCLTSKVASEGGNKQLRETIIANVPWSVQDLLRGNTTKFSIQWRPENWKTDIYCTVCKAPWLECNHWPGQQVDKEGGKETVWFEYRSARSVERSDVTNPAVRQTGVERWEQLSALRESMRPRPTSPRRRKEKTMDEQMQKALAIALGLEEGATGEAMVAAAKEQAAVGRLARTTETELREQVKTLSAERDAALTKASELEKAAAETKRQADEQAWEARLKSGLEAGKLLASDEKALRDEYAQDPAIAIKLLARLEAREPIVPTGNRQSSEQADAVQPTRGQVPRLADGKVNYQALFAQLPDHLRETAGKHASNPEAYIKANNQKVAAHLGVDVSVLT